MCLLNKTPECIILFLLIISKNIFGIYGSSGPPSNALVSTCQRYLFSFPFFFHWCVNQMGNEWKSVRTNQFEPIKYLTKSLLIMMPFKFRSDYSSNHFSQLNELKFYTFSTHFFFIAVTTTASSSCDGHHHHNNNDTRFSHSRCCFSRCHRISDAKHHFTKRR